MITALYASLLGILWLGLTMHVVFGRWKYHVSLGDGQQKDLRRRIRTHANFVETVPFALILLWFGESEVFNPATTHAVGLTLVFGRLIHAYGMIFSKSSANRFRQVGMGLTMMMIAVTSIWILISAVNAHFLLP